MIKVQNVSKQYGQLKAVNDISFEVGTGQVVGLLGPNGAGKTTIMKVITGYHFPTEGTVEVNGLDLYQDSLAIKAEIGYLPENAPLYSDMNVYDYLRFVADARGISADMRENRIGWVIEKCGLTAVATRPIEEISKGYRQRTGLAQAIIHDPPILILDEPTTGLDPNQIIEIRQLILDLGKEKTVILSTHILQEVEAVCDTVLILNKGKIAAMGVTEEIATNMRGGKTYMVTVRVPDKAMKDKEQMTAMLSEISGVDKVLGVTKAGQDSAHDWRAELIFHMEKPASGSTGDDTDCGEILFDWAVKNKMKILEMTQKKASLEDVFTKLTVVQKKEEA